MIAGPINYPAVKVFTASNLKVFAHSIKTYSFGECAPFEMAWCKNKEDATAVKRAISTYLMTYYKLFEEGALGYYRVESDVEITMAFEHGFNAAGVTGISPQERQQELHAKALAKEQKILEQTNRMIRGK